MSLEPVNPDDPQLTAYALGELSAIEAAEFEARLEVSPLAQSELAAMSDLTSMLSTGLKREWKFASTRECKVNFDDPKYTAFALGELSDSENELVKDELAASPSARKEMDSMMEVMSMLSSGLKTELEQQSDSPMLKALPAPLVEDDKVVALDFSQNRRAWMGVAAAAVALLGAAFTYFSQPGPVGVEVADWGSGSSDPLMESSVDNPTESLNGVTSSPGIHVPQLFLAEEVEDAPELGLAGIRPGVLDASYLDADQVGSNGESNQEMQIVPAGFVPANPRIDSYLPQEQVNLETSSGFLPTRHSRGLTVESFVPQARQQTKVDRQIRLAADFQGVQLELEEMVARFPQGSAERRQLELIVERNRRALGELKMQFSE